MSLLSTVRDTPTVVENWPYGFQHIDGGSPLFKYLSAYASQVKYVDERINGLYDARFVDSASGRELEKLAAEVGIHRQSGENDDDLRFRTKLRKVIAASDGTASDIEVIMEVAFGEGTLADIDVTHATGDPVTNFDVPQTGLDDIPLTRSEFESELERAFPAGYGVTVTSSDTWVLGSSGSQGIGNGALI